MRSLDDNFRIASKPALILSCVSTASWMLMAWVVPKDQHFLRALLFGVLAFYIGVFVSSRLKIWEEIQPANDEKDAGAKETSKAPHPL